MDTTRKEKQGRPSKSSKEGIDKEIRDRDLPEDLWMNRDQWQLEIRKGRRFINRSTVRVDLFR